MIVVLKACIFIGHYHGDIFSEWVIDTVNSSRICVVGIWKSFLSKQELLTTQL